MSSSQVLAYWKKDKFAPLRASLLIQGQISYFFIGQGGLVRFSYSCIDRIVGRVISDMGYFF